MYKQVKGKHKTDNKKTGGQENGEIANAQIQNQKQKPHTKIFLKNIQYKFNLYIYCIII